MMIRTIEDVDTRKHGAGHRFRAQLEGAITIDGVTLVPNGAFVHCVVSAASINVPRGTLLETTLRTPLVLQNSC